jgi:hypothetical protein
MLTARQTLTPLDTDVASLSITQQSPSTLHRELLGSQVGIIPVTLDLIHPNRRLLGVGPSWSTQSLPGLHRTDLDRAGAQLQTCEAPGGQEAYEWNSVLTWAPPTPL